MRVWRPDETRELVELWPIASTSQIAEKSQRPRSAIASKALRLRDEGLLPCNVIKHFDVNPQKRRKPRGLPKPPSSGIWDTVSQIGPHLAMQPCSILELDTSRCHWPLGNVNEVATEFCGGVAMPNRCYCAHHLRAAFSDE